MQKTIHTASYHNNYWSNLRVERNLRIVEIAEKTGIPRGSLGNYFTGKLMPKDHVIEKICELFDVSFLEGKSEFYNGYMSYQATHKQEMIKKNSTSNPDYTSYDPVLLDHKVIKKHNKKAVALEDKTSHKIKHITAWRQRFNDNNVTATDFAKYIGKEKSTVIKYISGKNRPPKEITQMFADYFHIPYSQAAEEFQIGYEQYHHIEHKKPKKLVSIDDTAAIELPEIKVNPAPKKSSTSNRALTTLMKSLYGKIDADTYLMIMNKGKISESKLRELYLNLDFDTFMDLSKFLNN